ncbi:glycosyltransferase [Parvularcula marina]|uniref:Uncharacterized protein n=1 Tax=Parvularcula marina TaxID=2292771 RepID=A0A371RHZ6_9PROT|nr:glycosyltransferase [Parvularcula marina]RFB05077.1 hypothetical protein DX908_07100 [Parvularcula marina]
MRIAVFGHDAADTMLARRIGMMERLGHEVTAFTMRRDEAKDRGWKNIDLGQTYDAKLFHRAWAVRGAIKRCKQHARLQGTDLFWARNLDMLTVAIAARRDARSHAPVIYETLDIHRMLTNKGTPYEMLRKIERRLMRNVSMIVTSSPAYEREYFDRIHPGHPDVALIENKLPLEGLPPRPATPLRDGPLRLGWVGVLRCARSFAMLQEIAKTFAGRIEVILHGAHAADQLPDFEEAVARTPHMTAYGRYTSPIDLPKVYGDIDIVWSGDYFQSRGGPVAIGNSSWALANRLYEGGYYGVPAIVPQGTEMARWIERVGTGRVIPEPVEETLPRLLEELMAGGIVPLRQIVADTPSTVFVDDGSELDALLSRLESQ